MSKARQNKRRKQRARQRLKSRQRSVCAVRSDDGRDQPMTVEEMHALADLLRTMGVRVIVEHDPNVVPTHFSARVVNDTDHEVVVSGGFASFQPTHTRATLR